MKARKVLLVQLRKDLFTKQEEYLRFLVVGGLSPAQLDVWDVFEEASFAKEKLEEYSAVFMGGSSDDPDDQVYFTQDRYPFADHVLDTIAHIRNKKIPFLASCMGFHMVNQALGGEIVVDKENQESGTYDFVLNSAGLSDALFRALPKQFPVVSYHKKRSIRVPEGMINLGSTEKCPIQVIKIPGQLFYAFQFHPELDKDTVARWAERYKDKYQLSDEYLESIRNDFEDTVEANSLVRRFLDLVDATQV